MRHIKGSAMAKTMLGLAVMIGLSACGVTGASEGVVCSRLSGPVQELSDALAGHPGTPEAVGEAGTEVVIIAQSGCGSNE